MTGAHVMGASQRFAPHPAGGLSRRAAGASRQRHDVWATVWKWLSSGIDIPVGGYSGEKSMCGIGTDTNRAFMGAHHPTTLARGRD